MQFSCIGKVCSGSFGEIWNFFSFFLSFFLGAFDENNGVIVPCDENKI